MDIGELESQFLLKAAGAEVEHDRMKGEAHVKVSVKACEETPDVRDRLVGQIPVAVGPVGITGQKSHESPCADPGDQVGIGRTEFDPEQCRLQDLERVVQLSG